MSEERGLSSTELAVGIGAAVAVAAGIAYIVYANPTTTGKQNVAISLNVNPSSPTTSQAITVSGILSSGGQGVSSEPLQVSVDGSQLGSVTTETDGSYSYAIPAQAQGNHTVEVAFAGDADYNANSASASFQVTTTTPVVTRDDVIFIVTDSTTGAAVYSVSIVATELSGGDTVYGTTDSSGQAALTLIDNAVYEVTFTKAGYNTGSASVSAAPNETVPYSMVEVSGIGIQRDSVTFIVTDYSTGLAVQGVALQASELSPNYGADSTSGTTDASGKATLSLLDGDVYTVTFSKVGYNTMTPTISVSPNEVVPASLVETPGGGASTDSVTFVVTDYYTNAVLAGVAIQATETSPNYGGDTVTGVTDSNGQAVLKMIDLAIYATTFTLSGYVTETPGITASKNEVVNIQLVPSSVTPPPPPPPPPPPVSNVPVGSGPGADLWIATDAAGQEVATGTQIEMQSLIGYNTEYGYFVTGAYDTGTPYYTSLNPTFKAAVLATASSGLMSNAVDISSGVTFNTSQIPALTALGWSFTPLAQYYGPIQTYGVLHF